MTIPSCRNVDSTRIPFVPFVARPRYGLETSHDAGDVRQDHERNIKVRYADSPKPLRDDLTSSADSKSYSELVSIDGCGEVQSSFHYYRSCG